MSYLTGPDVSKWQGVMDWQKTKKRGAHFAIIRAGSIDNVTGKCYADYQWERNKVGGPALMPCLAYWYARPNHSAEKQADYFLKLVEGADIRGLVIDLEETGDRTPDQVRTFVQQFSLYLFLSGMPVLVYGRAMWLNSYMAPLADPPMLWVALHNAWLDHPWATSAPKYKPRDWDDWLFWQFTACASGDEWGAGENGDDDIDLNYFNGSEEQFAALFGKVQPVEDEMTEDQLQRLLKPQATIINLLQMIADRQDVIIELLEELADGGIDITPGEPEPEVPPVDSPYVYDVQVKADKTLANVVKSFNNAGRPLMVIYSSDGTVAGRKRFDKGAELEVIGSKVQADGGSMWWLLAVEGEKGEDLYINAAHVVKL